MTELTTETDAMAIPGDAADELHNELASTTSEPEFTSHNDELEQAITTFLEQMGNGVVSVSRVVNPLLQVWSVARDVDAVVAVPVENLLTVLVGRSITTSDELAETMTEVRAILAESSPLATV
jgi:hypothetical protein